MQRIQLEWAVKIPLRDGVHLSATIYRPSRQLSPQMCVLTLTPYVAQTSHETGMYFAQHGLPFVIVDSRGRGNSEGTFRPFIQEAHDGYDAIEWLSNQPYCNGKVATWGGSYGGYDQWAMAKELPPHLVTIVPVASGFPGVDVPIQNNIFDATMIQWVLFTGGRTSQERIYVDQAFWSSAFRELIVSGKSLRDLDEVVGIRSPVWQEWLSHPHLDEYWDSYAPTAEQYAQLRLPVLTITGAYDGDQAGALQFYEQHMRFGNLEGKGSHYLIIGPWDHAGTRIPKAEFGGLKFGPASLLDLPNLHAQWYAWTAGRAERPEFLQKRIAYYVAGAETWRYADTLEDVTRDSMTFFLDSDENPSDAFHSGSLNAKPPAGREFDHYRYDPRDLSATALEGWSYGPRVPVDLTAQSLALAGGGARLVYHTAPFEKDTEVSGFFKLLLWIGIDQPDTDFCVAVYEVCVEGGCILLSNDVLRARYRSSFRTPQLISSTDPLPYEFNRFTFISRRIRSGHRLRLVIGPVNSLYSERNYNTGGIVAEQSMKDARPVSVCVYHDSAHPSTLYVPIGQSERGAA